MIIYPTIELQQGRCVSLYRGRLDEPQIWHVDPVETAQGFAADGAEWMHVTDFDAVAGDDRNHDLLGDIIRGAGIPVQLAGGFRTRDRVEYWIDQGAGRIVIGTLAVQNPDLVKELAKHHPDQIALALDVYKGRVMVEGWRSQSALSPEAVIKAYDGVPLAAILLTDIDADVDESDGTLGLLSGLAGLSRTPVIASGVVRSVDDVARLKYIPNIAGAIVGRALFSKTIELGAALDVARPEPEPVAEFQ